MFSGVFWSVHFAKKEWVLRFTGSQPILWLGKYRLLPIPSLNTSAQIHQWKHRSNVWNLFKITNEDTKTTSKTSFLCLDCSLWADFTHCSGVFIVGVEQVNVDWVNIENYPIVASFTDQKNIENPKKKLPGYDVIFLLIISKKWKT